MDKDFEFDDAYAQLLNMVKEIENDNVSLNDLAQKVAEAQFIVKNCDEALRKTEAEINDKIEGRD